MRTDDEVRAELERLRDAIIMNWRPFDVWFSVGTAAPLPEKHGNDCGVDCAVCYERVFGVPVAAHGDGCNADCLVCYVLTDNGLYYRRDGH